MGFQPGVFLSVFDVAELPQPRRREATRRKLPRR
jgi:hypothetical protein